MKDHAHVFISVIGLVVGAILFFIASARHQSGLHLFTAITLVFWAVVVLVTNVVRTRKTKSKGAKNGKTPN